MSDPAQQNDAFVYNLRADLLAVLHIQAQDAGAVGVSVHLAAKEELEAADFVEEVDAASIMVPLDLELFVIPILAADSTLGKWHVEELRRS